MCIDLRTGGATHLLVYSANGDGESIDATSLVIVDVAIPLHAPLGIVMGMDTDLTRNALGGALTIFRAFNELDVTYYDCRFGDEVCISLCLVHVI